MEAMRGGAVVAGAFAAPHHAIPGWPFMNGKQAIRRKGLNVEATIAKLGEFLAGGT